MNKKDRIAVVLSIPVLVLCSLGAMADGILFTPAWFVIVYWSYRFIKGIYPSLVLEYRRMINSIF